MTDYRTQPPKFREEMKSELGELSFSVVTIANSLDVTLTKQFHWCLRNMRKE